MELAAPASDGGSSRSGATSGIATSTLPRFQLSLLGRFQLLGPNGPVDLGSKKLCGLVAVLACAGTEPQSRELLTSLFWGSHFESQARQNLRQALRRLRRALGDDIFVASDESVAIRPGLMTCDVNRFEANVRDDSHDALAVAVDLYRDRFLSDVSITEETWADWVGAQRHRLESMAVTALIRLGEEELKQKNPDRALELARRAVAIDNVREDAHRLIIRSLASSGRRTEGLKHYDELVALLKRELNVEPDAGTKSLATNLRMPSAQWLEGDATPAVSKALHIEPVTLPSIAVLPFRNLGDHVSTYFGDGMVEDIVISLASLKELFVISRGSTLGFRDERLDAKDVGRTLGVRYVVTGSVRQAGNRLRVSIELSDTETGHSLWAERLEAPLGDLFSVQDDIVEGVVAHIAPHIRESELRRALRKRPDSFTAYDLTLQAIDIIMQLDRANFDYARVLLRQAIEADPVFAMSHAWAARWHSLRVGQGWSQTPAEDSSEAVRLAMRSIELDRQNALGLATYAHLKSYLFHDYDVALAYFDRALSACPNHSLAWILSSGTLSYVGQTQKAIDSAERGLRLSPFDRGLFYYYMFLMLAHYAHGNYEDAVKWGRLAITENATYTSTHRFFAASLVANGNPQEAREVVDAMMNLEPDFTLDSYVSTRQPFREPVLRDRLLEHLRQAGFSGRV